jgi:hypothetical protein
MKGISPKDELLNKAFQLAYFILGDRTASIYVAMAAIDKLKIASTIQDRRLYYMPTGRSAYPASRTKVSLSDIHLLQRLVYTEAEPFERLIEGQGSLQQQDMIIRFIKHLVRITTKHNSFYVVLGFCRVLHNYTTSETTEIYNLLIQDPDRGRDDYYYRSRKKHLLTELRERFGEALKSARGFRGEERFQPQEDSGQYLELVRECLIRFTPWESSCVLPLDVDPSKTTIAGLLFKGKNPDDEHEIELNRIHTLLHPDCFESLVTTLGFDAPAQRLEIPYFFISNAASSSTDERLKPEELSDGERQAITRYLDKNVAHRRDAAKKLLSILIDGYEQTFFEVGKTGGVQFNIEEDSELIEIRSIEPDEHVTIGLHLIAHDEAGIVPAKTTIKLGAGRSLSFSIQPSLDASNGTAGALVDLKYHRTTATEFVSSWRRQFQTLFATIFRLEPGASLNYARLALASSLLAISVLVFLAFRGSRTSPFALSPVADQETGKQGADEKTSSISPPSTSPAQAKAKTHPNASQTSVPKEQLAQKQSSLQAPEPGSITPGAGSTEESETTRGRQRPASATLTEVKRVYVDSLGADRLSLQVQELLSTNLQSSGQFVVVERRAEADAVFKGVVRRVNQGAEEVSVSLRLVNARGEVVWSTVSAYSGYRADAINKLINDLLADIRKLERRQ